MSEVHRTNRSRRLIKDKNPASARWDRLRKISAGISAELNSSKVLKLIIERGIELLGLDSGGIALWNSERRRFVVPMAVRMPAGFQGSTFRKGEGISGKVLQTGKTIVLDDDSHSPLALRSLKKNGYKAIIGTPIRLGDRVIGSLNLQTKSPHKRITQEDRLILEGLAAHAAVAIRNSYLFESNERRRAQTESLRKIGKELSAELNLQKVLKLIVLQGVALTGLELGAILLWKEEEARLKVKAVVNASAALVGKKFRLGETDSGKAAQERRTVIVDRSHRRGRAPARNIYGIRSGAVIAAPMIWREKVVGALVFGSRKPDRIVSEEDQRVIEILSQHAAVAIVNANLFNSLQLLNEQLERKVEERTRELERLHDEVVQKEKFATLGQIAGSVNHELRQPLEVITNAVYFLKLQLKRHDIGPIQKDFERFLNIISQECGEATSLVNELLDFTRKKEATPYPIDLNQLIESLLSRIQVPSKVKIRKRFDPRLPRVMVDPAQVSRALSNLVINGFQAMPSGGGLSLSTRAGKNEVEILIKDSGVGIAPENMNRIFQPLFTTKARGIGLGLSLVKKYLDANRGRISVQSKVGVGTTFRITFPISEKP